MAVEQRIRLEERHGMEGGLRCPMCGSYTSIRDIIATGRCRGGLNGRCAARLAIDLVVLES
jgi:hypothetical protein